MPLYFITGSKGKFEEVKAIIPQVEMLDIDLPEMQEVDAKKIIEAKLRAAFDHHEGEFLVEDTSLYYDALNGLPGPLVKWFLKTIGNEGLYTLAKNMGNTKATARAIIGYAKNKDDISFFEGVIKGEIVSPRGDQGFGWDPVFQPEGHTKTFAEMTLEEKNSLSMRKLAALQLKQALENS